MGRDGKKISKGDGKGKQGLITKKQAILNNIHYLCYLAPQHERSLSSFDKPDSMVLCLLVANQSPCLICASLNPGTAACNFLNVSPFFCSCSSNTNRWRWKTVYGTAVRHHRPKVWTLKLWISDFLHTTIAFCSGEKGKKQNSRPSYW